MRRKKAFWRGFVAVAGVVPLALIGLTAATAAPAGAAKEYWPSLKVSPNDSDMTNGQILKVTGSGFPPNKKVTINQCNQGMLDAPNGVTNSNTCVLSNATTAKTTSTGTVSGKIAVDTTAAADIYIEAHYTGTVFEAWGWANFSMSKSALISSNPSEPWLNPQTAKLTGSDIPVPATGTADYVVECNPNFASADTNSCDQSTAAQVTVSSTGKLKGKISLVMGTVGDGTCGTGTSDEVCYLALGNIDPASGTETLITDTAFDFYENGTG
jgi:hypothetical protein